MRSSKSIHRRLPFMSAFHRFLSSRRESLAVPQSEATLSKDDVFNCYRYILGREPEDESVAAEVLQHHQSIYELRMRFLRSSEFREQYKAQIEENEEAHPYVNRSRDTVVFIHLLKTGGTTFHALLESNFSRERIWPHHHNNLHRYAAAELGQYDLFSGHFDINCIGYIPREQIKTVCIFRNPQDRLISFYRFLKSHPNAREFEHNIFVHLAHRSTAEEFFEHPEIRTRPEVFNHYLMVFGFAYAQSKLGWPPVAEGILREGLDRACKRVLALDGIGITERFNESLTPLFRSINVAAPSPNTIKSLQVTDRMSESDVRFSRTNRVNVTPRLSEALSELTVYDDEIYRVAQAEFDRRLARDPSKGSVGDSAQPETLREDAP